MSLFEEKDACYHKVKKSYDVFPSARASQAIAKCRKSKGQVKKSEKGSDLKRWAAEKWTDTKSGKPCGAGGDVEYCRPKKKVSSETPKTSGEMSKDELAKKKAEKSRVGMGDRVTSVTDAMHFILNRHPIDDVINTLLQEKESGIPERYRKMGFTARGQKKKSNRPGKKWMVLSKSRDGNWCVVHGGYVGMQDFTQHKDKGRQKNFWSRMGGRNSAKAKDPCSPLYWHKKFKTW